MSTIEPTRQYLERMVKLPDGREVVEQVGKVADVQRALTAYDPGLVLVRNFSGVNVPGGGTAWEVHEVGENGHQGRVALVLGDYLPEPGWWVDDIRSHDTHAGYDPFTAQVARQELAQQELEAQVVEAGMASADQIHYELRDEFSAHAPATRPMFLGNGKAQ